MLPPFARARILRMLLLCIKSYVVLYVYLLPMPSQPRRIQLAIVVIVVVVVAVAAATNRHIRSSSRGSSIVSYLTFLSVTVVHLVVLVGPSKNARGTTITHMKIVFCQRQQKIRCLRNLNRLPFCDCNFRFFTTFFFLRRTKFSGAN